MGIVFKSLRELLIQSACWFKKCLLLGRDPSMAQVYLGNFCFIFTDGNIYFLELQYFGGSSYRTLITIYINFCEKN